MTTEPNYVTTEEPLTKQFTTTEIITSTVKWPESTLKPLIETTTFLPEELSTTENIETTTTKEIIFVPSTLSPPTPLCDRNQ